MISLDITVDGAEEFLARIPDGPQREQGLGEVLDQGRLLIEGNVKQLEPVLTGYTRRNTTSDYGGLVAHVVVNGGGVFADQGAAPHDIAPSSAAMLRFVPGGGRNPEARLTGRARKGHESVYVFSFLVHHPGQPAQHFFEQGFNDSIPDWNLVMQNVLAGMISG